MGIYDEIRKCAVFLGWKNERGFTVEGTGFLATVVEEEHLFSYVITAAHILWPNRWVSGSRPHQNIDIRISTTTDMPHISQTTIDDWHFHSDKRIDICAAAVLMAPPGETSFKSDVVFLSLPDIALMDARLESPGIEIGDEVFLTSAFIGRVGDKRNIPVVRFGHISAMPEEPISFGSPRVAAYLVETKSLGGTSGAPVFLDISGDFTFGVKKKRNSPAMLVPAPTEMGRDQYLIKMPYLLVGMILGSHSGSYSSDFVSENDTDIQMPKDVDFNAGISVAMTAKDIVEFVVSDPILKAKRQDHLRILEKESGYRPSSSGAAKRQTGGNPSHKEDFTSLLNGAAKRAPQDDQT